MVEVNQGVHFMCFAGPLAQHSRCSCDELASYAHVPVGTTVTGSSAARRYRAATGCQQFSSRISDLKTSLSMCVYVPRCTLSPLSYRRTRGSCKPVVEGQQAASGVATRSTSGLVSMHLQSTAAAEAPGEHHLSEDQVAAFEQCVTARGVRREQACGRP